LGVIFVWLVFKYTSIGKGNAVKTLGVGISSGALNRKEKQVFILTEAQIGDFKIFWRYKITHSRLEVQEEVDMLMWTRFAGSASQFVSSSKKGRIGLEFPIHQSVVV